MIPSPLRKWWWETDAGDDRPSVVSTHFPNPERQPYLPPEPPYRSDPELGDMPEPPHPPGWSTGPDGHRHRGGIIQLGPEPEEVTGWLNAIHWGEGCRRRDRELAKARRKRRKRKPKDKPATDPQYVQVDSTHRVPLEYLTPEEREKLRPEQLVLDPQAR